MFCTRVAWACLACLLLCKEEGSSLVSLQLLRGGIWICMRCHIYVFVRFGDGDYVSQMPYIMWIMLVLRAVISMLVSPRQQHGNICSGLCACTEML